MKNPYEVVANALDINQNILNENSAEGETPNWDSLSQLDIVIALEKNYDIEIADEDIRKYTDMKSIMELYKTLQL